MSIQVGKSTLVIVNWRADYARNYLHAKDNPECLTCPQYEETDTGRMVRPFYTEACKQDAHKRKTVQHITCEEASPEESKRAFALYGKLYRRFQRAGYHCGGAVYLLGENSPLADIKAELRKDFDEANAEFKHCSVDFDCKEIVLVPGELNEETLKSLKRDVENTVNSLLVALHSGNVKKIKECARETKQLATVLIGDSKLQTTALAEFAADIAKRLKDAAEESTLAAEQALEASKSGAARFASILFEEEQLAA